MNCHETRELLNDHADGLLPEDQARSVRQHLNSCIPCRRESLELEQLLQRTADLDSALAPERDLWPEVLERLKGAKPQEGPPQTRHWAPRWAYAAAAALALVVLSVTVANRTSEKLDEPSDFAALETIQPGPVVTSRAASEAAIARSEDGVLQAKVDLLTMMATHGDRLDPDTLVELQANLELLDVAIAEIRQALEEQPGDRWLSHRLAARYRSESALLKRVSRV